VADGRSISNRVYDILVEICGARESLRGNFVDRHEPFVDPSSNFASTSEFRFQGKLGFGGKFWVSPVRALRNLCPWFVSCYSEDETPEREAMVRLANERLLELWQAVTKEHLAHLQHAVHGASDV
jgi:hypothetical protein